MLRPGPSQGSREPPLPSNSTGLPLVAPEQGSSQGGAAQEVTSLAPAGPQGAAVHTRLPPGTFWLLTLAGGFTFTEHHMCPPWGKVKVAKPAPSPGGAVWGLRPACRAFVSCHQLESRPRALGVTFCASWSLLVLPCPLELWLQTRCGLKDGECGLGAVSGPARARHTHARLHLLPLSASHASLCVSVPGTRPAAVKSSTERPTQ